MNLEHYNLGVEPRPANEYQPRLVALSDERCKLAQTLSQMQYEQWQWVIVWQMRTQPNPERN